MTTPNLTRTSILVPILLFVLALGLRSALALAVVKNGGTSWFPNFTYIPTWGDYSEYVGWANAVQAGLNPYSQSGYSYPPLFLVLIYPFHLVSSSYGPMIPIVLSDAAAASMIYLVGLEFSSTRLALAAGLTYSISPIALIYEGILWLSSEPVTLFLLVSIYLIVKGRSELSALGLAASILCNQEALFVLPVFVVLFVKDHRESAMKSLLLFFGSIVAVSLPFLLTVPGAYLSHITFGFISIGGSASSQVAAPANVPATTATAGGLVSSHTILVEPTYILQVFARYLKFAFCLLVLPLLFMIRRTRTFPYLSMAYLFLVGLTIFSTAVPVERYYFIPVYALLLAISSSRGRLCVVALGTLVSLVTPETEFQLVVALVTLMIVVGASGSSVAKSRMEPAGQEEISGDPAATPVVSISQRKENWAYHGLRRGSKRASH